MNLQLGGGKLFEQVLRLGQSLKEKRRNRSRARD